MIMKKPIETNSKINQKLARKKQGGFTLVELSIVMLIIAVLGALSYPKIRTFLISGKTKPTADDVTLAVTRIRANAEGTGNTPYAGVATNTIANTLRERTNALTVTGVGNAATLQHKLGATGAQVTAAPATITTAGDSFSLTFPTVNSGACPDLATSLQNSAEIISINGTVVKSVPAGTVYNGQNALAACTADDTNTYVFTFR
jgi:type IV pilus assembly protein PilA